MSAKSPVGALAGNRFMAALAGKPTDHPPIWLMRQAGRYLPEYRATRASAGTFLDLCYSPAQAAEVTLQPIRRYGFDASILFADILIVPDALGQPVRFAEGEGPRLEPIRSAADLARLRPAATRPKYALISETVHRLRQDLPRDTALIGFCGAPWTVATYMIGGKGSNDQAAARMLAYRDPALLRALIDMLVETSADYLSQQVEAGANVLQIFDSWAGSLPEDEFACWVTTPTKHLIAQVRRKHPDVPIIAFPRGISADLADVFLDETSATAISCDTAMPLSRMKKLQARGIAVQGNLDPLLLVSGGAALEQQVRTIIEALGRGPFVFNLGHGIVPETPPENVARLVEMVRERRA